MPPRRSHFGCYSALAQLEAALVTEFSGLRTAFVSARGDQVGTKGEVSEARGAVKTTRTALELLCRPLALRGPHQAFALANTCLEKPERIILGQGAADLRPGQM